MIPVVIPVKPLERALGRLSSILEPPARRALQAAMLADVLVAATRFSDEVIVVTADATAASVAHEHCASVVPDSDPPGGINEAVRRGIAAVRAEAVLVVMGDLPGTTVRDLRHVAAAGLSTPGITIAVSRDGTGSNAMLLVPPTAIVPAFGSGSLRRHLRAAAQARIDCTLVTAAGLMLDVDTPDDLASFARTETPSHTRELCEALGLIDRLTAGAAG